MVLICESICAKVLCKNTIIYGIGNELRLKQDKIMRSVEYKLKCKIHGLDYNHDSKLLLVYGDKEFMILTYNEDNLVRHVKSKTNDWIITGKVTSDSQIILLTAHSTIILLELDKAKQKVCIIQKISCVDKSTLYCARIEGRTWSEVTIFGGTALGEIIIWNPVSKNVEEESSRNVLQRIPAHNGVVFSIDIDLNQKVMITTSDDRSVRVWSVEIDNEFNWSTCKFNAIKSGFGHTARVFKGIIINRDDNLLFATAGEDSNICIWNKNVELLLKKRLHFGATIWDLEYDKWNNTIVSCGSDGNVLITELEDIYKKPIPHQILIPEISDEHVSKIKYIKSVIIAITNKNNILVRTSNNNWKKLDYIPKFKCTELQAYGNIIALGGYAIVVLMVLNTQEEFELIYEGPVVSNIVRCLIFLGRTELIVGDSDGSCKYTINNFETKEDIKLPHSKERWLTSAIRVENFLILNDRQGNSYLYSKEGSEWLLANTLYHVHGFLGITKIVLSSDFPDYCLLKTSGHDYAIKTIKLDKIKKCLSVVYIKNTPVSWINNFLEIEHATLVFGYNDNHFVLWSNMDDFIWKVPCGGGNRSWDVSISKESTNMKYLFIKNKSLFEASLQLPMDFGSIKLQHSWHITQCNIVRHVQKNSSVFIFSGGEDGVLKCSKFIEDFQKLQILNCTHMHISSIKCIAIVQREDYWLVFSGGGRAQICVVKFFPDTSRVEHVVSFMLKQADSIDRGRKVVQEIDFDPETRFMDMDVLDEGEELYIFVGCSDGSLRKFKFINNEIELNETLHLNSCILHTKIVKTIFEKLLLVASTSGHLIFYKLNSLKSNSKHILRIKHHSSGVNSCDFRLHESVLYVITGGDDQQISISTINVTNEQLNVLSTIKAKTSHTSQVNGLIISQCCRFFFSVGIDQVLYKHCLNSLEISKKFFSCISDIKGLNICNMNSKNVCLLYGCGIQTCFL